jgi:hypothetical protein
MRVIIVAFAFIVLINLALLWESRTMRKEVYAQSVLISSLMDEEGMTRLAIMNTVKAVETQNELFGKWTIKKIQCQPSHKRQPKPKRRTR